MVVIRLSPSGKKGDASYKILVTDKAACLTGRFIEKIGLFKPGKDNKPGKENKDIFNLKADRYAHWLKIGAVVSPRLKTLVRTHKIDVAAATVASPVTTPKAAPAPKKVAAPKVEKKTPAPAAAPKKAAPAKAAAGKTSRSK